MTQATPTLHKGKFSHRHWLMLGIALIVSGVVISTYTDEAAANRPELMDAASRPDTPLSAMAGLNASTSAAIANDDGAINQQSSDPTDAGGEWQTVKVKRGDNLSLIFSRLGISPQSLYNI